MADCPLTDTENGNLRRRAFLVLFLLACAGAVSLQRLVDPDLFWHLRAGQDILRAGRAALPDTWTYVFAGKPWVNQQWLTQILLYKAYDWGGYWGLALLKGLLAAAVFGLVLATIKGKLPGVRYLTASVAAAYLAWFFMFRTHTFSLLGMASLVFLLERVSPKPRLFFLAALFALWANVHAFFGLGLGVLGLWTVTRWVAERAWEPPAKRGAMLWEAAAIPLSGLATLLNPFGYRIWETAFSVVSNRESYLVTEWWPVWKFKLADVWSFYAFLAVVAFLVVFFPKNIHWPSLVSTLVLAVMAVRSVRFTSTIVLPAVPLLAALLGAAAEAMGSSRAYDALKRKGPPLAAACLAAVVTFSCSDNLSHPIVTPGKFLHHDFPVAAVRWMKARGLKGKLFDEYGWGGYLAWALPESCVFIDGRTGVLLYPPGFVADWKNTVDILPGWRARLLREDPDFALLSVDDYLAWQLSDDPEWTLLYKDHMAALFARKR